MIRDSDNSEYYNYFKISKFRETRVLFFLLPRIQKILGRYDFLIHSCDRIIIYL